MESYSIGGGGKAEEMCKLQKQQEALDNSSYEEEDIFSKTKPASLVMQFLLLFYRNLLMTRRNYVSNASGWKMLDTPLCETDQCFKIMRH